MLEAAHARYTLRRCAAVGAQPIVAGRLYVRGAGNVRIGNHVRFDARDAPIELIAERGAEIVIGDHASIGGGTSIEARREVIVGERVHIGRDCKILDNHLHTLGNVHHAPESSPILVEPDARLGRGVILLPGAHVGSGVAVPPGAVVRGRRNRMETSGAWAAGSQAPDAVNRDLWGNARRNVRLIAGALGGLVFVRGVQRRGRIYAFGPVMVENRGVIDLGARVVFVPSVMPTRLSCALGATLQVDEETQFNRATVEAYASIRIGKRCMLAPGVRVCDKGPGGIAPISISDDVWLAYGVIVEPGVAIGRGSIVSAGSVVSRDVPPNSLAAGNPARSVSLTLAARRVASNEAARAS